MVGNLEDAEDYKAFEAAVIADYDPETAVARELVASARIMACQRATGTDSIRSRKARSCVVVGYFASPPSASSALLKRLFQSGRRMV